MVDVGLPLSKSPTRPAPRPQVVAMEILCVLLAIIDGTMAGGSFLVTALFYHHFVILSGVDAGQLLLFFGFAAVLGMAYATLSFSVYASLLERQDSPHVTMAKTLYGWLATFGVALLLAFVVGVVGDLSRVSIVSAFVLGLPLALLLRMRLARSLARRASDGSLHFQKVAIVGRRELVVNYLLKSNIWQHGRKLSAALYLDDVGGTDGAVDLDAVRAFVSDALGKNVESVIFVADQASATVNRGIIDLLRRVSINIDYVPVELSQFRFLDVIRIGATTALRIARRPLDGRALFIKRVFDVTAAGAGLIALSPLLAIVALAIKLETPGPVFFRQERRGFNGSTFRIWKFRSMSVLENGDAVAQARRGDLRITRVGRLIRATSIDELPQLFNVIIGNMSLVGPRPHAVSHDAELIGKLDDFAYRNRILPGITGWAQVNGQRGETVSMEQIEARAFYDLYYAENWSLLLDLWIIVLTVFSPRTHRGAF